MQTYDIITGVEWQEQVCRWLRLRYIESGLFDEIPDEYQGDWGIEGWSRDGKVYQCYAPQVIKNSQDFYDKHRRKITEDIGKFISNADDLAVLFDRIEITSWWYVIPSHRDKRLNKHAANQQKRVRDANLSFCSHDFFIKIASPDDFEIERRKEEVNLLAEIFLPLVDPTDEDLEAMEAQDPDGCETLKVKVQKMGMEEDQRIAAYQTWLRFFVKGKGILHHLHTEVPTLYERVRRVITDREKLLAIVPRGTFSSEQMQSMINELGDDISSCANSLSQSDRTAVVYFALSDWLLRCPWDFREANDET